MISITNDETIWIYSNPNLGSSNATSTLLTANAGSLYTTLDGYYAKSIKKIELGNNVSLSSFAFAKTQAQSISMPNNITANGSYLFVDVNMPVIIVSTNIGTISANTFSSNLASKVITANNTTYANNPIFSGSKNLKTLQIGKIVTTLGQNFISSSDFLTHIIVPKQVTSLKNGTFGGLRTLKYIDFSHHTSVPTITSTTFSNLPTDCKLIVPDSLYSTWITANYWSNYSTQIIKKSDWDAL